MTTTTGENKKRGHRDNDQRTQNIYTGKENLHRTYRENY